MTMRWGVVLMLTSLVCAALTSSLPVRRCAGRVARERLKAAEKIRDKRYFFLCCAPLCAPTARRTKPPVAARRYQPYHKLWYGLKYEEVMFINCPQKLKRKSAIEAPPGQVRAPWFKCRRIQRGSLWNVEKKRGFFSNRPQKSKHKSAMKPCQVKRVPMLCDGKNSARMILDCIKGQSPKICDRRRNFETHH